MNDRSSQRWTSPNRLALGLGALAGFLVLVTLGAPGITIDEPIDAKVGAHYLGQGQRWLHRGPARIGRAELDSTFADNAQHPPLGRWLLGLATLASPFEPWLGGVDPFSVHSARLAPMLAFALLVALVSGTMARRSGPVAGIGAGLALILFPRSFAHAHLATLDTFLSLFWTLALISADSALRSRRPVLGLALAGFAWGLALLTKIHAVLLPPLILLDALLRKEPAPRRRALGLVLWASVGLAVFFAGWPWLWFDTSSRLAAYLSTSTERLSLSVLYLGHVYPDRSVPWHYPWLYFALVVPVGLHVLGFVGVATAWRIRRDDPLPLVLCASILEFLLIFSTRAPVYDGERLFLHVFPAWAMLAGLGLDRLWRRARPGLPRRALVLVVGCQSAGLLLTSPCGLSYYNALTGGLPGATRLGLEPTYWGDALTGRFMSEVAEAVEPGSTIAVAPSMHHLYPPALATPALAERKVRLVPQEDLNHADWLLVFRREPYLTGPIRERIEPASPTLELERQGIWLARLIRLKPPVPSDPDRAGPLALP